VSTTTKAPPGRLRLLTLTEAAREVGITPETLRAWCRRLPAFPQPILVGERPYMRAVELAEWLDSQPRGGADESA
jgi:hypothetical protein